MCVQMLYEQSVAMLNHGTRDDRKKTEMKNLISEKCFTQVISFTGYDKYTSEKCFTQVWQCLDHGNHLNTCSYAHASYGYNTREW